MALSTSFPVTGKLYWYLVGGIRWLWGCPRLSWHPLSLDIMSTTMANSHCWMWPLRVLNLSYPSGLLLGRVQAGEEGYTASPWLLLLVPLPHCHLHHLPKWLGRQSFIAFSGLLCQIGPGRMTWSCSGYFCHDPVTYRVPEDWDQRLNSFLLPSLDKPEKKAAEADTLFGQHPSGPGRHLPPADEDEFTFWVDRVLTSCQECLMDEHQSCTGRKASL